MGGADTMVGDLGILLKGTIYDDAGAGNYCSLGLVLSVPSGRGRFGAGTAYYSDSRDTVIQGFLGYIFRRGNFYFQGCSAMMIPTSSVHASALLFDGSLGWIAYRAPG